MVFDTTLVFFFKNCFIISFLLWVLTFLGNMFFYTSEYLQKNDFYECGFKTTTDINFSLNFSFFVSALFVILYDLELLFLIPFLFNYEFLTIQALLLYSFFMIIILGTFFFDSYLEVIEWNF